MNQSTEGEVSYMPTDEEINQRCKEWDGFDFYSAVECALQYEKERDSLRAENERLSRAWEAKHKSEKTANDLAKIDFELAQELIAENQALREALKPSGDTKAAYIGEFKFGIDMCDEDGEEYSQSVTVPWTTVKEIMAVIQARAALKGDS